MILQKTPRPEPTFVIEEIHDPDEIARAKIGQTSVKRNSDWLQAHWADLLPQARGKYIAVAAQQAVVTDTAQEAWDWIQRNHPDDPGAFTQYCLPHTGPRIYAHRRTVVCVW